MNRKYNRESTATAPLDVLRVLRALEQDEILLFSIFDKIVCMQSFYIHAQGLTVRISKTRQYQLLHAQNTQLQTLLADAATRRGLEHAFRDPLFLTWPLSRFCELSHAVMTCTPRLILSVAGDSFAEVVLVYSAAYHTLRQRMPTSNEMPDNALDIWKKCKPAQSPTVLDFFEICDIELYVPAEED
jgi:hypothetical protein